MIPVLYPHLTLADFAAFLNIGKNVDKQFKRALCDKFGVKHALTYSSGRAGLYHILKAHNIENKNVLITAYTCCVVTEAIAQAGNNIIFIDADENSFNSGITEAYINKYEKDLGAVVITNLYGFSDYKKLNFLAKRKNFIVVIDDALSPGDISQAPKEIYDYIYISGGVRKPFTALGGGMVFTNNAEKYKLLLDYTNSKRKKLHPIAKLKTFLFCSLFFFSFRKYLYSFTSFIRRETKILQPLFDEQNNDIYRVNDEYFFDMCEFQKRIGVNQLKKLDSLLEKRKELGNIYYNLLDSHFDWIKKYWKLDTPYSHLPFLHPQRDKLEKYLLKKKIDTERYFDYAVPDVKFYNNAERFLLNDDFRNAKHIGNQILNLPISMELDEKKIKMIVEEIIQFNSNT